MTEDQFHCLVTPESHQQLTFVDDSSGRLLVSDEGVSYQFVKGFPDLTYPVTLNQKEKETLGFYEERSNVYDKFLYQTFKTHNENEVDIRNCFIDKLHIRPESKVLEIACGTGRDSELIANRLGHQGELVLQDISPSMLSICKEKLSAIAVKSGASKNAKYADGVAVFTEGIGGLMAEASVGGQKFTYKPL